MRKKGPRFFTASGRMGKSLRRQAALAIFVCLCGVMALLVGVAQDVLALAPTQQDVLAQLYKEAQEAQQTGDYKAATQRYERIVKLRPEMAEAHANLGFLYYQQGLAEQATETFKNAIRLKPSLAGPYFFLGVLSFNARKYDDASSYLERAEALDPSNVAIQIYLGYNCYARASYLEAVRHLEKAVASDGSDQDAFYHLSKAYGHLSEEFFEDLHKNYRDSFHTDLARAHFYEAEQNWEAAREEYSHALGKRPESERLRQRLDWVTQRAAGAAASPPEGGPKAEVIDGSLSFLYAPPSGGKIKEELQQYQNRVQGLVSQKDKSAEKLYELAEGYKILSYLASLWVFETAPDSYRAHQLKAQYYETLENDEAAVKEYRKTLELKPDLRSAHFSIGNLYWRRNRSEEALAELREELRLDPNHPQAHYEIGDILYGQGKPAEAEQHLLDAVKLDPSMIEAHLALERVYTSHDQLTKALHHLSEAAKIAPDNPTPHYRLSVIYRKLGRIQEAEKEMQLFERTKAQEKRR
jgi:tetratricopeptide (TPR) repeat protein